MFVLHQKHLEFNEFISKRASFQEYTRTNPWLHSLATHWTCRDQLCRNTSPFNVFVHVFNHLLIIINLIMAPMATLKITPIPLNRRYFLFWENLPTLHVVIRSHNKIVFIMKKLYKTEIGLTCFRVVYKLD